MPASQQVSVAGSIKRRIEITSVDQTNWPACNTGGASIPDMRAGALERKMRYKMTHRPKSVDKHKETATLMPSALQDILVTQPLVLIGLIAHLSDITLQEDIVFQAHRLHKLAMDILNQEQGAQRAQTSTSPGTATPGT